MTDGKKKELWRKLSIFGAVFLAVLIFVFGAYGVFGYLYKDQVFPGVYIGDNYLGGADRELTEKIINQVAGRLEEGVKIYYDHHSLLVASSVANMDASLAYPLFGINADDTVSEVMAYGRNGNFFKKFRDRLSALFGREQIDLNVQLNHDKLLELMRNEFSPYETKMQNASLALAENGEFYVTEESKGLEFDYQDTISRLYDRLASGDDSSIEIVLTEKAPDIFASQIENIQEKTAAVLDVAPLNLNYGEETWTISEKEMKPWLTLVRAESGRVAVALEPDKVKNYLEAEVVPEINISPQNAKFEVTDGKVTVFQAAASGVELDVEGTADQINRHIMEGDSIIEMVVKESEPTVMSSQSESLGITEVVGVGKSNFAGSPPNRRHNIAVGAEAINGLLIKPGEEFSLMEALGDIDAEAGYLPELVIKNNKTVPEYGGGLCQIGTTMFRTALDTGVDITMRSNHSYRVSYYEPAGTDATIYDPWPDFKFVNDTENYLLIQTHIEGDDLVFELWGTDDGREVEMTDPVIYNIVPPGPTKIVETLDLEPGVKKCTESAHNGADAYFDYSITYADGETFEKRYSSHYVPWQAVCLLGVEELSDPEEEEGATDPETTPETDSETGEQTGFNPDKWQKNN